MTEKTLEVFKALTKYSYANNICKRLQLTRNKLMYYVDLINKEGYMFECKYYSDGDIEFYKKEYTINDLIQINKTYEILPSSSLKQMHVLAISDLHIGNELQRLDLLDLVFNYCVNNNIHIILCCGDVIDGTYSRGEQSISDVIKQTETFIKKYPYDPNILTFSILGDHDFSALYRSDYDPMVKINKERHDIIISGYNFAKLEMMKANVVLHHNLVENLRLPTANILLHGHKHTYRTYISPQAKNLQINVPPLCDILYDTPGALDLVIDFDTKTKKATNIKITQLAKKGTNLKIIKKELFNVPDKDAKKIKTLKIKH